MIAHGYAVACALKQTFAQYKIFLEGTLVLGTEFRVEDVSDWGFSVKFQA